MWLNNNDSYKINEQYLNDLKNFINIYFNNEKLILFGFSFYTEIQPKIQNLFVQVNDYVMRRKMDKDNLTKNITDNLYFDMSKVNGII
jgi:hypothetical protein